MKPETSILKCRERAAALGLMPVAATLAALTVMPPNAALAAGTAASLCALAAGIAGRREMDPLLMLGALGTGTCAFVRLSTHGRLIPPGMEAPALEFVIMMLALAYLAVPALHARTARRLGLGSGWPCTVEAGIVVGLSAVHLLAVLGTGTWAQAPAPHTPGTAACLVPALIYTAASLARVANIRLMERESPRRCVVRIAPVYGGMLFLERAERGSGGPEAASGLWDLPIEARHEGILHQAGRRAQALAQERFPQSRAEVRLVHRYTNRGGGAAGRQRVLLYVLPLEGRVPEGEDGRFFSFGELRARPDACSPRLRAELDRLEFVAGVWRAYGPGGSPGGEQDYL